MSTLCFLLVLFTTQIINTKEVSSLDQNKTAPTSTAGRPAPKDVYSKIDFGKVQLFKDSDELPSDPEDVKRASNQSKQPINSTQANLSKNGPSPTIKGNLTYRRIYDDYDTNDLQLDKYKVMVAPSKYKTVNASNVRFLNRNPGSVNNPVGSAINQLEIKVSGKYVVLPNGTLFSGINGAKSFNYPPSVPQSRTNAKSNNSVTPIPWVISPACLQENESKYIFSAIFNKKPTVHLLTADNGTAPNNPTPKIVINQNSVTMSVGNTTPTNNTYVKVNSSGTTRNQALPKTQNSVVSITINKTTPVNNPNTGKLKIDDTLLHGLTELTMTIQNNTKPQDHATLSKFGNTITISGQIKTNETDKKSMPPVLAQTNPAAQETGQLIPQLQANVPVKIPMITITTQGTKKIEPIPLFLLGNNLRQTPIPETPFNRTMTTAFRKSQQAINNILNSELGERSFFPSEMNQNFESPTEKKTVSDLMTQKETDVQSSNILYELFKNMTITNVINEDLNRKLLDESQIHTQQNWQLIKDNSDILNVLKNKNE